LWRQFIGSYDFSELLDAGKLFSERFDASDPVGTPSGSAFTDPADAATARTALTEAVADLEAAGFPVDVPYGEVQFAPRGAERIPIHGGPGDALGITNAIDFSVFTTSSEPGYERAAAVREGRSLTTEGWPVTYGTSFVMTLEFTDDGPRAQAFLTYGESGDASSPHFSDQTQLFSEKAWRDILFTDEQIEADPELREYEVSGSRNA
jgi:acyl-homoserine-lactone acylase